MINRTGDGGVIELQGDRGKAMEQANSEMSAHCGGPGSYQIESEGEEAIGTDTYTAEDTSEASKTSRSGRRQRTDTTTTGQTSTRTATAWRVHYRCRGAGGPPPAGAPGGEPPPPPPGGQPGY